MEFIGQPFLIDADLLIDSILNRNPRISNSIAIWKILQSGKLTAYVTEIGFDRLMSTIRLLATSEDNADSVITILHEFINIAYLEYGLMQRARHSSIEDYESAIELLVAQDSSLRIRGIITHHPEEFRGKCNELLVPLVTPYMVEEYFVGSHNQYIQLPQLRKDSQFKESSEIPTLDTTIELIRNCSNISDTDIQGFIGMTSGLSEVIKCLQRHNRQVISVRGVWGSGKSRLALEFARLYWRSAHMGDRSELEGYDSVIFVHPINVYSEFKLDYQGYLGRTIAQTLNDLSINYARPDQQLECICKSLSRQKTLLILSGLDESKISRFEIDQLCKKISENVNIIITSRRDDFGFYRVDLTPMSKEDAIGLADSIVSSRSLLFEESEINSLVESCCFNPSLIKAVLLISENYPGFIDWSTIRNCDIAATRKRLAQKLFKLLKSDASIQILKVLAFANDSFHKDIIVEYSKFYSINSRTVDFSLAQLYRLGLIFEDKNRYRINPIINKIVVSLIRTSPKFIESTYSKLTQVYIRFTQKRGGDDWQDWHVNYDILNEEWENIQIILSWCNHNKLHDYLKSIWKNISRFSDLYGYWRDRLVWMDIMANISKDNDSATYIQSLSRKAWTLLMTQDKDSIDTAEKMLHEAWANRENASLLVQSQLADRFFLLYLTRRDFDQAEQYLVEMESSIKKLNSAGLGTRLIQRKKINLLLSHARLAYKKNDLESSKSLFLKIIKMSSQIQWSRGICYAYNKLADIAIREGRLEEADKYLKKGIPIAYRNRNHRRLARYQKSFSSLEKQRGNLLAAQKWREVAAIRHSMSI